KDTVISFECTLANQLNKDTFFTLFIPRLLNQAPDISFDFAKQLFLSKQRNESYTGQYTLFKKFADKNETWELFIDYFLKETTENLNLPLINMLAVLPWHPDIAYFNGTLTNAAQEYG